MKRILELHQLEKLADRFKLLSETSRLRILQAICREERSVSEICDREVPRQGRDRTKLNQANVSKHLQLLKSAGVVACRRVGICRYYRIIDLELLDLCNQGDRADNSFGDRQAYPSGLHSNGCNRQSEPES